jgi:hypothetical protein
MVSGMIVIFLWIFGRDGTNPSVQNWADYYNVVLINPKYRNLDFFPQDYSKYVVDVFEDLIGF